MAKQIKFNEFVDDKSIKNGLNDVLDTLNLIDDKLKDISKTSKDALNVETEKSFKGVKKLNEAVENSNKVYNQKLELDKERLKLEELKQKMDKKKEDEKKAITKPIIKTKPKFTNKIIRSGDKKRID